MYNRERGRKRNKESLDYIKSQTENNEYIQIGDRGLGTGDMAFI
jgi:hypothetical protein